MKINSICSYCNKEMRLIQNNEGNITVYLCENHPDVRAEFVYEYDNIISSDIYSIWLHTGKYTIIINYTEKYMKIYNLPALLFITRLPIDKTLSPENIKSKLKTYLLFI